MEESSLQVHDSPVEDCRATLQGLLEVDVKPGKILIDFTGRWHLTDYDSCTCEGIQARESVKYTAYYCPTYLNRQRKIQRNTEANDLMLLVVTVLDRLQLLQLRYGFIVRQLTDSVDKVGDESFKACGRKWSCFKRCKYN